MSKIRTRDLITYLKPLFLFFVGTLMWLELIDSYYQSSKQLFCLQYSVNDLTISSLALFCLSIWLYLFVIVQPGSYFFVDIEENLNKNYLLKFPSKITFADLWMEFLTGFFLKW